ncbi:hypothetical protein D3C76_1183850 [compost metagenome]
MPRRSMAWNMCICVTLVPNPSAAMLLLFMLAPISACRSGNNSLLINCTLRADSPASMSRFSQNA